MWGEVEFNDGAPFLRTQWRQLIKRSFTQISMPHHFLPTVQGKVKYTLLNHPISNSHYKKVSFF
jgi:hypothetical protein